MYVKLWPDPPLDGIHFDISFKDNLGPTVEAPQPWLTQLQCTIHSGLTPPHSILAFDKSVWAVCLLEVVHFKLAEQLVTCVFVDGARMDFPLRCGDAGRRLYGVVADVREAVEAAGMEERREREKERERMAAAVGRGKRASVCVVGSSSASASGSERPASPAGKVGGKHKKHRSLLVSLIAYVLPFSKHIPSFTNLPSRLISPTSTSLSLSSAPPSPSISSSSPPTSLPPSPRFPSRLLRKRARATIVDVFRRYVLPELPSPQPFGGYCYWIADSMLRRAEWRMRQLIGENGGMVPRQGQYCALAVGGMETPTTPTTPSAVEDDGSASAETTDTDGSELHSPLESTCNQWIEQHQHPVRVRTNSGASYPFLDSTSCTPPSPPSYFSPYTPSTPPSPSSPSFHPHSLTPPPNPATEYAILHTSALRYRAAMCRAEASERAAVAEQERALERLEARSRRRAWSSRALMGRADVREARVLGRPLLGSPLGWGRVVTAETSSNAEQEKGRVGGKVGEGRWYGGLGVGRAVGPTGVRRLSVVVEGEREVEVEVDGGVPQDVRLDAEGDEEGLCIEVPAPRQPSPLSSPTSPHPHPHPHPPHSPPAYFAQTMHPFPCFDYPYSDSEDMETETDGDTDSEVIDSESQRYQYQHERNHQQYQHQGHYQPHLLPLHIQQQHPESPVTAHSVPIGVFDDDADTDAEENVNVSRCCDDRDPSSDRFCGEFTLALDVNPFREQDKEQERDEESKEMRMRVSVSYEGGWYGGASVVECL
jgi:hypothetical protein